MNANPFNNRMQDFVKYLNFVWIKKLINVKLLTLFMILPNYVEI